MNTDSALKGYVLDELKWWPNVNAAHIGVAADGGVITLSGHVEHFAEKSAAGDAAKKVYGVVGLVNDIKVDMPGAGKRSDQDIAAAAVSAMKWDFQVPHDKVKVIVQDGFVTLEGNVDWQYQKEAAERCVRYQIGVVGVENNIVIEPAIQWVDVRSHVEDAIRRKADLEVRRIRVKTHDGVVTLSGSVSSFGDRDQAVWAAWSAPGVTSVVNELNVAA